MNEQTYQKINKWSSIAVQTIGYLFIIGFALTGVGIMFISLLTWIVSDISWMAGFGMITGAIFLSCAATLFIGKLMKDGDALQLRFAEKQTA